MLFGLSVLRRVGVAVAMKNDPRCPKCGSSPMCAFLSGRKCLREVWVGRKVWLCEGCEILKRFEWEMELEEH